MPGYEAVGWNGLVGSAGLPPAVVAAINAEVGRILKAPDIHKRLIDLVLELRTSTPGELAAFLKEEVTKWAKVVKESGARVD